MASSVEHKAINLNARVRCTKDSGRHQLRTPMSLHCKALPQEFHQRPELGHPLPRCRWDAFLVVKNFREPNMPRLKSGEVIHKPLGRLARLPQTKTLIRLRSLLPARLRPSPVWPLCSSTTLIVPSRSPYFFSIFSKRAASTNDARKKKKAVSCASVYKKKAELCRTSSNASREQKQKEARRS